jgi:hypothetical protein
MNQPGPSNRQALLMICGKPVRMYLSGFVSPLLVSKKSSMEGAFPEPIFHSGLSDFPKLAEKRR